MMIDIGVNFGNKRLKGAEARLVEEANVQGVKMILATGTSLHSSLHAASVARRFKGKVTATAGCHPHDASSWEGDKKAIMELWGRPEVVAVGECGLDFNRMFSPRDVQITAFQEQLDGALRTGLPLFLHCRDAFDDFRPLARTAAGRGARGVVHCFTGTASEAKAFLDDGWDIGVTGWAADERRGHDLREALKHIPLDRLHLETDAPFLTPRNMPGKPSHNEPSYLPWVARAVAEIKGMPAEDLARACMKNSKKMFNL